MDHKPFRPQIVDRTARSLWRAYGITDERREVLINGIATLIVSAGDKTPWFEVLDGIANIAETTGEFAYLTVVTTWYTIDNYIPDI
jgi:hypothetical protein